MTPPTRVHGRVRLTAGLLAASMAVLTACGGASSDSAKPDQDGGKSRQSLALNAAAGESGLAEAGKPQRGGDLIYGLESESTAGFCLSEANLAISGMTVARAFYDTLTVPNAEGGYTPYLAKSVTPNADYTAWTIKLRPDVTFHDGSKLDATVVKNNLDAYRGTYPGRSSLLFTFILTDVADTRVVDPLTVEVTTKRPWVSFPAYLFSSARLGIMAQAQLDASATDCANHPIGTGPFRFVSWTKNQELKGEANPDYWQIAPDGKPYPYVDTIAFRPIPDDSVRVNAVEAGDVSLIHTDEGDPIKNSLAPMRDEGKINLFVSDDQAEVNFLQLNTSIPPFDDLRMRQALAHAVDREDSNRRLNAGLLQVASGPMGPGSMGYLTDAGMPAYDPAAARKLIEQYRADTGDDGSFIVTSGPSPSDKRNAEQIQRQAEAVGLKVTVQSVDQSALIDRAIAGEYQGMVFRNFPGGDPDENYVWWYGDGNLVNFGKWDDAELNALLDQGRQTADPAARKKIYQDVNRIMATKVYGLWNTYALWAIALGPNVHNVLGPPLPGADPSKPGDATTDDLARQPSTGLATAHPLLGMWISK